MESAAGGGGSATAVNGEGSRRASFGHAEHLVIEVGWLVVRAATPLLIHQRLALALREERLHLKLHCGLEECVGAPLGQHHGEDVVGGRLRVCRVHVCM